MFRTHVVVIERGCGTLRWRTPSLSCSRGLGNFHGDHVRAAIHEAFSTLIGLTKGTTSRFFKTFAPTAALFAEALKGCVLGQCIHRLKSAAPLSGQRHDLRAPIG